MDDELKQGVKCMLYAAGILSRTNAFWYLIYKQISAVQSSYKKLTGKNADANVLALAIYRATLE